MSNYIGIDPGITGAICVMEKYGNVLYLEDMPVIKIAKAIVKGKKQTYKSEIDEGAIRDILERYEAGHVYIEKVQAMSKPRQGKDGLPVFGVDGKPEKATQGVTSMFNFGLGFGLIRGICTGMKIPYTLVSPQTWKAKILMDMPKENIYFFECKKCKNKAETPQSQCCILCAYSNSPCAPHLKREALRRGLEIRHK